MHNVPREWWRSPSAMAMSFSIFLSPSALPIAPRLSWQQAVDCHSVPQAATQLWHWQRLQPKLQPGRLWAQGHQRWGNLSQLCPTQSQRAPGALPCRQCKPVTFYWQWQKSCEKGHSCHIYAGYERTVGISKDTLRIKQKLFCLEAWELPSTTDPVSRD